MCIAIRLFLYDPQTHSTDVSQRFQVKDSEMTQSSLMALKRKQQQNSKFSLHAKTGKNIIEN